MHLMPMPRPKESSEEIRGMLKELAVRYEKNDLEYAAKVKAKAIPGELSVGWRFPKEEQIKKQWADWNVLYEQQTDLESFFKTKMVELSKLFLEQKEAERKEMEG